MVRLGEYRGCVVCAYLGFEKGERSRGEKWRNAQVVMGQARQDRERVPALWPALAHPAAVPEAAVEQFEHLDVVARAGPVGFCRKNWSWYLEIEVLNREIVSPLNSIPPHVHKQQEGLVDRRN